jgi:tripartite-type tricarboxylate transporter receptor subunit TctC
MRKTILASLILALPFVSPQVNAQATNYPDKRPITLIVPFGPGGTSDIMARMLQQPLAEALGTTVVIENKAGAGGAIGMTSLARAPADGYTIGLSVIGPEVLQPALRNTGYTSENFDHICGTYDVPLMMMVKTDSPYKNLHEVVQTAAKSPGTLVYGSSGAGTVLHLSMAMLLAEVNAEGLHIPYKSSGDMVTGLLGDHVAVFNETPTISSQYGLRGLAVLAKDRLAGYPEVPTAAEAGLPLQASVWGGLIAPAGLPAPIRKRLEAACRSASHSPHYQDLANKAHTPLVWRDGAAYETFVRGEQARYAQLIKDKNLASQQ